MRIQHNIMAMNAYRNYNNNTKSLSGNLEKLSSGYKINRAGDDAAGLAISEKMRAQISGLDAAERNVKDGISLVKTAEGAMQEIQDMLNRMKSLAVQSANGTYEDSVDREALQAEVDALKSEINRIADSANFNGRKLLNGELAGTGGAAVASSAGEGVATVESTNTSIALKTNQTGTAAKAGVYTATIKGTTATKTKAGDVLKFNVSYIDADGNQQEKTFYTTDLGAGATNDTLATQIKTAVSADADLSKLFTVTVGTGTNTNDVIFTANDGGTNGGQLLGLSLAGLVDEDDHNTAGTAGALDAGAQDIEITTAAADATTVDLIDLTGATIAAGDTVTVGDKTYEFVAANGDVFSVAKGNIAVVMGTALSGSITNLTEALKANGVTSAKANTAGTGIEIGDLDEIKATSTQAEITTSNKDGIVISDVTADKSVAQFTAGVGSGKEASLEITYLDAEGKEQVVSVSYTSDATAATNATNIKTAIEGNDKLSNLFTVAVDTTDNTKVVVTSKVAGSDAPTITGIKVNDADIESVKGLQSTVAGRDDGQTISLDVDKMANGDTLTIDGRTFQFVEKDRLDTVEDGNIAVILDKDSATNTAANLNLAMKQNNVGVEYNPSTNSFFMADGTKAGSTGGLTLQIGDTADEYNQLQVTIEDMHVDALGMGDFDISTLENAQKAESMVTDAINYVSSVRGNLGAVQNRLEHTQNNLSVMKENIQDAESTIRDTDIADEMTAYTKNNILLQSAQAMLAQANSAPQGVLSLLQ